MASDIDLELLTAYSRGEITRRDIEARVGEAVGFGPLLMQLHAHGLKLPRFPSDRSSPGFQLLRRLAERARDAG